MPRVLKGHVVSILGDCLLIYTLITCIEDSGDVSLISMCSDHSTESDTCSTETQRHHCIFS